MHSSFPLSERFAHCISVGVVQTVIVDYNNTQLYGVLLSHCKNNKENQKQMQRGYKYNHYIRYRQEYIHGITFSRL